MKRGIAALLMAFLLAGCGAPGGSLSAEESIDDAETVLHGETFTAENGCANLALTLPEGWKARNPCPCIPMLRLSELSLPLLKED